MTPRDERFREAARKASVNVLVEAGAGTGKTTLLVDRVIENLLVKNTPWSRMLLITFMDKAQQEMRQRVQARLQKTQSDPVLSDADRVRIQTLLDGLPDAEITTIHGFCYGILAEFGSDYGIPVGFRVMDAIEADRLWEKTFSSWLSRPDDGSRHDRILSLLSAGIGWSQLVNWARQISRWPTIPKLNAEPFDLAQFVHHYAAMSHDYHHRALQDANPDDAGVIQITEIVRQFNWLFEMDLAEWPRMLAQWTRGLSPKGNKKNWAHPEWLRDQKYWVALLKSDLAGLRRQMSDTYLRDWVDLIGHDFREEWRRVRFDDLALTYDDLLWEAERISRDPAVWSRLYARYDLVAVDEFQDTDGTQAAIIRRLVTAPGGNALMNSDQGRLFLVGDPKQSIYRFRGADVETYTTVRHEVAESGGAILPITENFRSHPRILDFVNHHFAQRWPTAPDPERPYIPPFIPLHSPFPDDGRVRVSVKRLAVGEPYSVQRHHEAEAIGAVIDEAVREGWPVRTTDGVRPLTYQDIALVVPQRTGLEIYRAELQARHIPVASQSGRAFFQQAEIRGLRHLYHLLAYPEDEVAVVGWLASPWVGMDPVTLAGHRLQNGAWQYLVEAGGHPAVREWWGLLRAWHQNFWRAHPESVLDWAMSQSPLIGVLRERSDEKALANLSKMRELCRQLGERWDIFEFEAWLDGQVSDQVPFEEAPVPNVSDAVLMTTVHQAKGLEWPMVIVANWTPSRTGLESGIHYNPRLKRAALNQVPWQSSDWDTLAVDHQAREEAETDRLLYVALTRARDYLWFFASFLDGVEESES